MTELMTLANILASLVILGLSLCSLNRMTPATHHGVRLAVVLIAVGAFAEIVWGATHESTPRLPELMLNIGVAAGIALNRRRSICPCSPIGGGDPQHSKA